MRRDTVFLLAAAASVAAPACASMVAFPWPAQPAGARRSGAPPGRADVATANAGYQRSTSQVLVRRIEAPTRANPGLGRLPRELHERRSAAARRAGHGRAAYKPRQPRGKIKDQMKDKVAGKLRSFKQGDIHKLELSADLKKIWKGALVDEFAATDRKSTRYWALSADPA